MSDTELQLIGYDDEYMYFNVYIKDEIQGVICLLKVKSLKPKSNNFESRFKHRKRIK